MAWLQHCKKGWLTLSIKKKIWLFTKIVFGMIILSIMFDSWVIYFSVHDFQSVLEENARNCEFLEAIEEEITSFKAYIKQPGEEKRKEYEAAIRRSQRALDKLPYGYRHIGEERYAQTWSIKNTYGFYRQKREEVLRMGETNPDYVKKLYEVYEIQDFLQEYTRKLMTYTLRSGTHTYLDNVSYLRGVITAVGIVGALLIFSVIKLACSMNHTIIVPVTKLADASKRIAANDFDIEDVKVCNQDEMGELVHAFNRMKQETRQYIHALEEKRRMMDLLHQEELEKLEIEKQLEAAKFELVKNQIKPHFLFNTLNVIGGMAKLEDAKVTQQMILSLSMLFRYNLKTTQAEVSLEQELQAVRDYMYLQQMRFGSRVAYEIVCKVNTRCISVPTFSLQPIIENAIIHGLCRKERGGKIYIRVWQQEHKVIISIADTGVGMSKEKLEKIRQELKEGTTEVLGIGLGTIYARVHAMYKEGKLEIFSKEQIGTVVQLYIA